jgi:triacylglycerol esterase/lipase EstA (alpha/beta hydrolase family)
MSHPLRSARLLSLTGLLALAACGIDAPTGPMAGSALYGRKPPKPNPTHNPILFVHGYNASSSTWTTMVGRFKNDGWADSEIVNWSYNYRQSNATTAAQIAAKVDSILATGPTKVDIITHSMGALSARYYVRNLGGDGKVDALVTLGGANHGTNTALFCLDVSCVEMRPNSSFLTALNSIDESWGTPRYATWWSPCDEVISPQSSALLLGATNNETGCLQHSQLHENSTVYSQVKTWVQ